MKNQVNKDTNERISVFVSLPSNYRVSTGSSAGLRVRWNFYGFDIVLAAAILIRTRFRGIELP